MVGGILGLIGVFISLWFSRKTNYENKQFQLELKNKEHEFELKLKDIEKMNSIWLEKYNLLITLMSYRHEINSKEFRAAMNGISALFQDSTIVMDALKNFYNIASKPLEQIDPNKKNESLVEVFYTIFLDLEISEDLDKSFLEKTFHVQEDPLSFYELQQLAILDRIADSIEVDPNKKTNTSR